MCEWFDETCGQLLDRLDEKGVTDNTLVIYVLTTVGFRIRPADMVRVRNAAPTRAARARRSCFAGRTGSTRPSGPSCAAASTSPRPSWLLRAPNIPERLPGLNLLPNLHHDTPIQRDTIFGEAFAHDIADIQNPQASLIYRWVIRDHSKLVLTYDGSPRQNEVSTSK